MQCWSAFVVLIATHFNPATLVIELLVILGLTIASIGLRLHPHVQRSFFYVFGPFVHTEHGFFDH